MVYDFFVEKKQVTTGCTREKGRQIPSSKREIPGILCHPPFSPRALAAPCIIHSRFVALGLRPRLMYFRNVK